MFVDGIMSEQQQAVECDTSIIQYSKICHKRYHPFWAWTGESSCKTKSRCISCVSESHWMYTLPINKTTAWCWYSITVLVLDNISVVDTSKLAFRIREKKQEGWQRMEGKTRSIRPIELSIIRYVEKIDISFYASNLSIWYPHQLLLRYRACNWVTMQGLPYLRPAWYYY